MLPCVTPLPPLVLRQIRLFAFQHSWVSPPMERHFGRRIQSKCVCIQFRLSNVCHVVGLKTSMMKHLLGSLPPTPCFRSSKPAHKPLCGRARINWPLAIGIATAMIHLCAIRALHKCFAVCVCVCVCCWCCMRVYAALLMAF